jgi:hypothetical protein
MSLPRYSPDMNPIQQRFAKLKALLRKANERTIDNLWDRIGKILDEFSTRECANCLANSGYASIRSENAPGESERVVFVGQAMHCCLDDGPWRQKPTSRRSGRGGALRANSTVKGRCHITTERTVTGRPIGQARVQPSGCLSAVDLTAHLVGQRVQDARRL